MSDHDPNALMGIITVHEKKVWEALVSGDRAADDALLSDRFLGVYPDGFAGKQDHCGQLDHGPTIHSYEMQEIQLLLLGAEHALLSYRANFQRQAASQHETMYVSSVWQRAADGWINIFSQDTPAAPSKADQGI